MNEIPGELANVNLMDLWRDVFNEQAHIVMRKYEAEMYQTYVNGGKSLRMEAIGPICLDFPLKNTAE